MYQSAYIHARTHVVQIDIIRTESTSYSNSLEPVAVSRPRETRCYSRCSKHISVLPSFVEITAHCCSSVYRCSPPPYRLAYPRYTTGANRTTLSQSLSWGWEGNDQATQHDFRLQSLLCHSALTSCRVSSGLQFLARSTIEPRGAYPGACRRHYRYRPVWPVLVPSNKSAFCDLGRVLFFFFSINLGNLNCIDLQFTLDSTPHVSLTQVDVANFSASIIAMYEACGVKLTR